MPILYTFNIKNNSILANVNSTKQKVADGMLKGMHMGADELRDFIKNELLSGQSVQKRTGQLRNSLYVRRTGKKLTIFFRGMHRHRDVENDEDEIPNAVLAQILEYGLNKTWWQPKRNRWHKGIKPHYFMQEGLIKKKERIIQLVKSNVYTAIRTK
jgi:hypothetical protein